jgi:hypothetical protein
MLAVGVAAPAARADQPWWRLWLRTGPVAASGHAARLEQDSIFVRERKGSAEVVLPFTSDAPVGVPLSWQVTLTDLNGKKLASSRGEDDLAAGSSEIPVGLLGYKLPAEAGDEMGLVVGWRVEVGDQVFRGRRSLYHIHPKAAVTLAVPDRFLAGIPLQVPVYLTDALTGKPLAQAELELVIESAAGKSKAVARTDLLGAALLKLPPQVEGKVKLLATARTSAGSSRMTAQSEVVEESRVFLSTDKPLYQPGQSIHIRALVMDRGTRRPAEDESALVEVLDAKGNKVFKQVGETNRFGVVAARFDLASQVNLGRYTVVMTAGDTRTEKTVTVDRYVLPKFKLDLQIDREFYQPSQVVEGTVDAHYFFGKPVSQGDVRAVFHDYQGEWVPDAVIEGHTDDGGIFHFKHTLPSRLVGQPVAGGNALVLLEVEVTDGAGQKQKSVKQLVVSASPVQFRIIPESGSVVPGVENRFFAVLADPAGSPLDGNVDATVQFSDGGSRQESVPVDRSGLGTLRINVPSGVYSMTVGWTARGGGGSASGQETFTVNQADANVLLRTGQAVYRAGDTLEVEVLAAGAVSDAFLDVTRDNQTVALASVALNGGRGRFSLPLDSSLSGTLAVSAWVLSERGEYTRDSRVVFVNQASDLRVSVASNRGSYKPGETARIDFQVSDPQERGVQSALGIHVVDEAVFALSESRPGLLKLFFALEEELLKPSWQIGPGIGLTLGQLILGSGERPVSEESAPDARDREGGDTTAQAAIAAQGDVQVKRQAVSSSAGQRERARQKLDEYAAALADKVRKAISGKAVCADEGWSAFPTGWKKSVASFKTDPWGHSWRKEIDETSFRLDSAGPDGTFGNWDDVAVQVGPWDVCPQNMRWERMRFAEMPMAGAGGWAEDAAIPAAMPAGEREFAVKTTATVDKPAEVTEKRGGEGGKGQGGEVRVRQWFPETLFVENFLVTDEQGKASLDIPLADSITTWRLSAIASDRKGNIGGKDAPITVFQDFFVDVDFPVFLTRNDTVEFPVAVYNYLDREQVIEVRVDPADWFQLLGKDRASLKLAAGQVSSVRFPVKVTRVGHHALTVYGNTVGSQNADAVRRVVQVRPDGKEVVRTQSGRFRPGDGNGEPVTFDLAVPPETIEGSAGVVVQVLPGLTSHVVQGMDSMLRLPGG